jgi:hypothetical protein
MITDRRARTDESTVFSKENNEEKIWTRRRLHLFVCTARPVGLWTKADSVTLFDEVTYGEMK